MKEWRVFAQLDPTFTDCSASTDSDSRMATIRQLLDNTQRDLQNAEANLGEFNYHTTQITTLSEKIQQLETKITEITIHKNQANALCQILAAEGERLEKSYKVTEEKYHRHYELLQQEITIQEWFRQWQENADMLARGIRQMASEWKLTSDDIADTTRIISDSNIKLDMYTHMLKQCQQGIEMINGELRKQKSKKSELGERRQSLLPTMSTGEALDKSLNAYYRAQKDHAGSMVGLQALALQQKELEGAHANVRQNGDTLDQKASAQRSLVDLWIRAYNANHPPVQYSELNTVLTKDIDWNEKRQRIRDNQMATSLQQQKVKALQSEIVALEVDTGTLSNAQLNEKQIATERCSCRLQD